jgi:DNA-binding MarR family transcriptional regulator
MNSIKLLLEYLKQVTGEIPKVEPLPDTAVKGIPFFLRDSYTMEFLSMMGHRFVVANAKGNSDVKPGQIAAYADLVRKILDSDVAFVFSALPAYLRQRLVQKRVAFIVPGVHLFLPFMVMDFRTRTRNAVYAQDQPEGALSMPSQLVLLYHLQRRPVEDFTLGQLSKLLRYSAMTLSRVLAELTQRGLCEAQRDGVRKSLRFVAGGRKLWNKAFPFLQSPEVVVKEVMFKGNKAVGFLHAGMTALSDYTMLADDPVSTIAVFAQDWRRALKEGIATKLRYSEESGVRVEVWGYDPVLPAETGNPAVDRLSLYLSCKDNPDERVQSALDKLMEDVQWSKE